MAVYFVPKTAPGEEQPTPADGDNYTYDLRPAAERTADKIRRLERRITSALEAIAALEEPARRTRETLAALFGDGRLSPKAGRIIAGNGSAE